MKKAISLFITFALILVGGISVYAAESDISYGGRILSESTKQKVFDELLEGRITNEEDTIRVALEQYQERQSSFRTRSNSAYGEDNSFSITQTLEQHQSEDGDTIQRLFTTNLLVLDKSNKMVTPKTVVSEGISLSNYQIYAYMSVDYIRNVPAQTARINSFTTTLNYGTAMKAASLYQEIKHVAAPFEGDTIDAAQTFYNPAANVSYKCTSNNSNMISFARLGCGVSCLSTIKAGTQTAMLAFKCTNNAPSGAWDSSIS